MLDTHSIEIKLVYPTYCSSVAHLCIDLGCTAFVGQMNNLGRSDAQLLYVGSTHIVGRMHSFVGWLNTFFLGRMHNFYMSDERIL